MALVVSNAASQTEGPAAHRGSFTEQANRRGCFCGLWDTNPRILEADRLPRGYCGICEHCGRPGHGRHFPGPVPRTGSWCDRHYRLLLWASVRGSYGQFIWLGAVVCTGAAAVAWLIL